MSKTLWSIQFAANNLSIGTGIITLDGNQIIGGNDGYYYLGTCNLSGSSVNAVVTVRKYNPDAVSIFGDIDMYTLLITGILENDQITFSGYVGQNSQMKVNAIMKKLADLD